MLLSLEIQALQALADRHDGTLTAEMVVEAARDPAHPLHNRFTWDDAEAAHEHRLNEARHVIRNVRIEVRRDATIVTAPLFVRDPAKAQMSQGYVSIPRLISDEERARAAVVAEFQHAAAYLRRAKAIAAALNLVGEIEELETQLTHVQGLARSGDSAVRAGH